MRLVVLTVLLLGGVARADSVDARDSSGWTALQRAAQSGDLVQIEALVKRGASLEVSSPTVYDGATAFVIALHFTQPAAAQLLLDRGASTAGKLGTDALLLAARDGDDAILDLLIKRHVAIDPRALAYAAKYDRVAAIARLIKAGAKVNVADADDHAFTPLIVACQENKLAAARALLDAGARIDDVDDDHHGALYWAVFGARPDEIHLYEKLDRPHTTVYRAHSDAPLVALLVARGVRLGAADTDGNTALHMAAMFDAKAAAIVLVRAGADRAVKNHAGATPYAIAKERHNSVEAVVAP